MGLHLQWGSFVELFSFLCVQLFILNSLYSFIQVPSLHELKTRNAISLPTKWSPWGLWPHWVGSIWEGGSHWTVVQKLSYLTRFLSHFVYAFLVIVHTYFILLSIILRWDNARSPSRCLRTSYLDSKQMVHVRNSSHFWASSNWVSKCAFFLFD